MRSGFKAERNNLTIALAMCLQANLFTVCRMQINLSLQRQVSNQESWVMFKFVTLVSVGFMNPKVG